MQREIFQATLAFSYVGRELTPNVGRQSLLGFHLFQVRRRLVLVHVPLFHEHLCYHVADVACHVPRVTESNGKRFTHTYNLKTQREPLEN